MTTIANLLFHAGRFDTLEALATMAARNMGDQADAIDAVQAKRERRKPTSGGPRDRARHLAYQRAYQARRTRFGVRTEAGVVYYPTRREADLARRAEGWRQHAGLELSRGERRRG